MKINYKIDRLQKISLIMQVLPESNSIRDISKKTAIPESTVQSLLHKSNLIAEVLELNNKIETIEEIDKKIQVWFQKNKKEGSIRGATMIRTLQRNHPTIRRK